MTYRVVEDQVIVRTAGSHHFVCCDQIQMPDNPNSPHGNYNPLERVIKSASNDSNYSWCVITPAHPPLNK